MPNKNRYTSNAKWPKPEVSLGTVENVSTDYHETQQEAESICKALRLKGFGGNGRIFPIRTWVGYLDDQDKNIPMQSERDTFNTWFRRLLHRTNSCFERDVLRENKEHLWVTWQRFIKEDNNPNQSQNKE